MQLMGEALQSLAAHAVADQKKMQVLRPGGAGVQHGTDHHVQALRRGERAGEHWRNNTSVTCESANSLIHLGEVISEPDIDIREAFERQAYARYLQ